LPDNSYRCYSCTEALCEEVHNGSSTRLAACRSRFGLDRLHADDRPSCLAEWIGMARDFENKLFRACSGRSWGLSAARIGGLVASKSVCRTIGRGPFAVCTPGRRSVEASATVARLRAQDCRKRRNERRRMRPAKDVLQRCTLGKAINNVKNNAPELLA
jgi:hypothetical protein